VRERYAKRKYISHTYDSVNKKSRKCKVNRERREQRIPMDVENRNMYKYSIAFPTERACQGLHIYVIYRKTLEPWILRCIQYQSSRVHKSLGLPMFHSSRICIYIYLQMYTRNTQFSKFFLILIVC